MTYNAETKVWTGPQVARDVDNELLREIIWKNLSSHPDKVYQICDDDGTKLTYNDTKIQSIRVAQNLQRLGVGLGDVVVTSFANTTLAAPVAFGCTFIGAPIFTFSFKILLNVDWIKQKFLEAKPKIVILEEHIEYAGVISDVISEMKMDCKVFIVREADEIDDCRVQSCTEILKETGTENEFVFPVDGCTDASTAFIIPSSGTTGPPKGIALSAKQCKLAKYCWEIREDPVVFTYSTISWYSGFLGLFFSILNCGSRVVSRQKFSPKNYGRIVRQYSVTNTIASTAMATIIYKSADFNPKDFESMREFICGGERVPQLIRNHFSSKLRRGSFATVYGSTEAGLFTTFLKDFDLTGVRDNIVGKVQLNTKCKVVDLSNRKALGHREVGELLVITETIFNEYCGRPEQTASAFENGWYKTGDVGYIDENGFVYVFGRAVDMITYNGMKVHPAGIEGVIECFEGVAAACVLNVAENVIAALVIKLPDSNITGEFLEAEFKAKFLNVSIEGGIYIVEDIPRTSTVSSKIFRPDAKILALKLMGERCKELCRAEQFDELERGIENLEC